MTGPTIGRWDRFVRRPDDHTTLAHHVAGFSASRILDESGRATILRSVGTLAGDEYVTGGAIGGDALLGQLLWAMYPKAVHTVIVPANRRAVDPWWERISERINLIFMPDGSTYEDRNAEIVQRATCLYAYPRFAEHDPRSRRSGTWQTVRLARRAGKSCTVHILER